MNIKKSLPSNSKQRLVVIGAGVAIGVIAFAVLAAVIPSHDERIQTSANQIQQQVSNSTKAIAAAPKGEPLVEKAIPVGEDKTPTQLSNVGVPIEYDLNKDGKITTEEIYEFTVQKVMGFDANGDGKLDKAEFAASVSAPVTDEVVVDGFVEIDSNKDGFLSSDEVGKYVGPGIADMDKNGDGNVDPAGKSSNPAASSKK